MSRKSMMLGHALGAIVLAGAARAEVDMALEQEALRDRFTGINPNLGAPYGGPDIVIADESFQLKNPQADVYASAADLISPLPDRLSVNPESPFYGEYGSVGVRFDGSDRPGDVEEYCVSEGWIRVRTFMANGKPKRERGKFVCLKRHGKVEPYRK